MSKPKKRWHKHENSICNCWMQCWVWFRLCSRALCTVHHAFWQSHHAFSRPVATFFFRHLTTWWDSCRSKTFSSLLRVACAQKSFVSFACFPSLATNRQMNRAYKILWLWKGTFPVGQALPFAICVMQDLQDAGSSAVMRVTLWGVEVEALTTCPRRVHGKADSRANAVNEGSLFYFWSLHPRPLTIWTDCSKNKNKEK